jgi:hypothetical protein
MDHVTKINTGRNKVQHVHAALKGAHSLHKKW